MASEISHRHTATGDTLYFTIRNVSRQMWNTSGTPAFESLTVANWGDYDIALSESPASSYFHVGTMPAVTEGWYWVDLFKQVAGSPAISDTMVASYFGYWDGTTFKWWADDAVTANVTQVDGQPVELETTGTDTPGTTTLLGRVVGTLASGTHQPQSGDAYAIVSSGTYGNSALKTLIDDVPTVTEFNARTLLSASYGTSTFSAATDGVILASIQSLYAPSKAGDAMALTSAERISLAAAIEAAIINDLDGTAVMQAIADLIASDMTTGDLSVQAIASACRDAILNRVLAGNHDTTGTPGKLLQNADVAVSTRLATTGYTAPDNTTITAISNIVGHATYGNSAIKIAVGSPQQVGTKYAVTLVYSDVIGNVPVNVMQWNSGSLPSIETSSLTAQQVWEYVTRTITANTNLGLPTSWDWVTDSDLTSLVQYGDAHWATSTLSAAQVATAVLVTPANKLATNASGYVDVADKTGFKLASDGLDSISTTAPTGVASNFREMLVQMWRRFFKKATRTPTELKTYADNGTTVLTTQVISDNGSGTESQGTST